MRFAGIALATALMCMPQERQKLTPFPEFIRQVKQAEANEFLPKAGTQVKDAAAFDQMRKYVLKLYGGVHVQHSYLIGAQTIDCIPENEQPSVREQGEKEIATPPNVVRAPNDAAESSKRPGGAEGCVQGTIPMRRITLEELTRFRTLDDFLHKAPHGRAPMPPEKKP